MRKLTIIFLFATISMTSMIFEVSAAARFAFALKQAACKNKARLGIIGSLSALTATQIPPGQQKNTTSKDRIPLVFLGKNHGRRGDGYFAAICMDAKNKERQSFFTLEIESEKLVAPSQEILSQHFFEVVRPKAHVDSIALYNKRYSAETVQRIHDSYQEHVIGTKPCSEIDDPVVQHVASRIAGKSYCGPVKQDSASSVSPHIGLDARSIADYVKTLDAPTTWELFKSRWVSFEKPEASTNVWLKQKDLPAIFEKLKQEGVPADTLITCYPDEACYVGSNNTKSIFEKS